MRPAAMVGRRCSVTQNRTVRQLLFSFCYGLRHDVRATGTWRQCSGAIRAARVRRGARRGCGGFIINSVLPLGADEKGRDAGKTRGGTSRTWRPPAVRGGRLWRVARILLWSSNEWTTSQKGWQASRSQRLLILQTFGATMLRSSFRARHIQGELRLTRSCTLRREAQDYEATSPGAFRVSKRRWLQDGCLATGRAVRRRALQPPSLGWRSDGRVVAGQRGHGRADQRALFKEAFSPPSKHIYVQSTLATNFGANLLQSHCEWCVCLDTPCTHFGPSTEYPRLWGCAKLTEDM